MSIFRAYDIRGIVDETLTTELTYQIGQAIGSEAIEKNAPKVTVARDGRLSSEKLADALSQGLLSTGCDVYAIGLLPTPALYFSTYALNTGSGVMITGSHNPPNYNGLKMMVAGDTLFGDAIQKLKQRIDKKDFKHGQGQFFTHDILATYIDRITSDVKLQRPFKLVIDCGNGVAGRVAPQLFRALGCEVIELFCEVDGHFPNHHPDPSKPENLQDLIAAVKQHQADLGFAFDGDGDRLGVIDANGKIIWPDRQMVLYSGDVLSRNAGGKIIFDVKCSRHLANAIAQQGGEPIMWKTGHSFIKTKIKESGALLGGEMSGHIFFKERWYGFDDALYTGARLLEILSKRNETPTAVFATLADAVNTPELNLNLQEGEHFALMERICATFKFDDAKIATIDGLRVDFADGWGLVRASNTTPCLVLRFEADNAEALARIQQQFRTQMLALDSSLQLPF